MKISTPFIIILFIILSKVEAQVEHNGFYISPGIQIGYGGKFFLGAQFTVGAIFQDAYVTSGICFGRRFYYEKFGWPLKRIYTTKYLDIQYGEEHGSIGLGVGWARTPTIGNALRIKGWVGVIGLTTVDWYLLPLHKSNGIPISKFNIGLMGVFPMADI